MEQMEIQEQFEALVNKGVEKVLAPHRESLIALAELVRSAAPDNQERCQEAPRVKRENAAPRVVKGAVEAAANFSVGQKVRYRQGRGEFEATVDAINRANGELTLMRASDGKVLERPATKVSAA